MTELYAEHHQFYEVKFGFTGLGNFLAILPPVQSHCTSSALLLHLALSSVAWYLLHTVGRSTWQDELSEGCTGLGLVRSTEFVSLLPLLTPGMSFKIMQSNHLMSLCLWFQSPDSHMHEGEEINVYKE